MSAEALGMLGDNSGLARTSSYIFQRAGRQFTLTELCEANHCSRSDAYLTLQLLRLLGYVFEKDQRPGEIAFYSLTNADHEPTDEQLDAWRQKLRDTKGHGNRARTERRVQAKSPRVAKLDAIEESLNTFTTQQGDLLNMNTATDHLAPVTALPAAELELIDPDPVPTGFVGRQPSEATQRFRAYIKSGVWVNSTDGARFGIKGPRAATLIRLLTEDPHWAYESRRGPGRGTLTDFRFIARDEAVAKGIVASMAETAPAPKKQRQQAQLAFPVPQWREQLTVSMVGDDINGGVVLALTNGQNRWLVRIEGVQAVQ